jgi:alpha-galactosidase
LPVVFNEYCTTWGTPSHENIKNIVETVKSKGIKYFIIDAGWYADKSNGWFTTNGDWIVSDELFPYGLEKTVELITNAGMIPGIWFELETCSTQSKMFKNEEHLLKRNGYVITSGNRRFLDMNDPWVNEYLTEKVIGMLKKYGFKYIKVDYNETIGVGCDGAESLGEGLKQNMLATQAFFKKIRAEIPDIVIENCSSGGHRLEPSMMALSDMASFSDAHECREIPIIAANLHRAIQPSKSQIWAVLRKTDSLQRIAYSLAGTFLGVMCLSGDVNDLDSEQWKLVDKGIDFYNSVSHIIASGETRYFGSLVGSYRSPEGWQAVVRYSEDKNEIMVVVHTFGGSLPENIQIPLEGTYKIKDSYVVDSKLSIEGNNLNISEISGFQATAVYLSY